MICFIFPVFISVTSYQYCQFFSAISVCFVNIVPSARILSVYLSVQFVLWVGLVVVVWEGGVDVPYFSFICVTINFPPLFLISLSSLIAKKNLPSPKNNIVM